MKARWILLALWMVGCGAEGPGPIATTDAGATAPEGGPSVPVPDPTDQMPEPLLPPTVQAPTTSEWDVVPVRGKGPKDGIVVVETEAAGVKTALASGTGEFCIDVPLVKGKRNKLSLRGQDIFGELSAPTTVEIEQTGEPPVVPPVMTSEDLARGGKAGTNMIKTSGGPEATVDGDVRTSFTGDHPVGWSAWVWIDLRKSGRLEKIRVRSAHDCPLKHYAVFISNVSTPGDPPGSIAGSTSNWTKVSEITQGTGDDTILFQAQNARTISIRAVDLDCGTVGLWYRHKITDVQAWTEGLDPNEKPRAPSCLGGL